MPARKPTKLLPSQEHLRECLDYDPDTGQLTWKRRPPEHFPTQRECEVTRWNARYAGTAAGGMIDNRGYYHVKIDRCRYKAHRLIWKWMTGDDPETIDHIDGYAGNNRWSNLRDATQAQQIYNALKRGGNWTGHRGVLLRGRDRWWAHIKSNGVMHRFGPFATLEEASAAYEAAAREFHGEFYLPYGERKA